MKKLHSLIFALIAFAFISCNDDETEPDTQAPTVTFSSLSDEAIYEEGENIYVEAEVKDNLSLEIIKLSVSTPDGETHIIRTLSADAFTGTREAALSELYTPAAGLAGPISFTIEAGDKAGNTTTESKKVFIREADKNAPVIAIRKPETAGEFLPDDAILLESHITDESALDEITVWVRPEGGLSHLVHTVNPEVYTNDGKEANLDEVISLSSGTPLPGNYTITIKAGDEHGNIAEERLSIQILEVDTHAPSIEIRNPEEGTTYYPDEEITFRAKVSDNLALASVTLSLTPPGGEASVVYTAGSEDFVNDRRKAEISQAISFGSAPVAGEYTLTVTATDEHENVSAESIIIQVREVDPNAPTIAINSPEDGAEFDPAAVVTFEANIQDDAGLESASLLLRNPEGETRTVHTLNREDFSNDYSEATISETIPLGTTAGNYTITLEATDAEGNSSEKSVVVVVRKVDLNAPAVAIHDPLAGAEYTTKDAIYIRAGITDESRLDEVTVWLIAPDGQSQLAHTENRADFFNEGREAAIEKTISLGSGNAAAGTYTIMVRAIDEKGNTAEESVSINVREADITPPTITVNAPETGASFQPGDEVLIDALVEDDQQLAEIHVKVTLGGAISIHEETITEFDSDTRHHVENRSTIPADAPTGTYKVTITATDAEGNQAIETLTFQVTVGD